MTPELAPFEILFLAASARAERPWPTDPYLKASARAAFAISMAETKIAEVIARAAIIDMYREELRACVRELDMWTDLAELLTAERAKHADRSPFLRAFGPPAHELERVGDEVTSRDWFWCRLSGRFVRRDEGDHGETG